MPTHTSPGSGRSQHVVATRFVQVVPASTTSGASGRSQHEATATLSNLTPAPSSGGGGSSGGGVDPGAGVNPGVVVRNPMGRFTTWAPVVSYTGWGGE